MFDALAGLIIYRWPGLAAGSHAGAALHCFVMLVIVIRVMGLLRTLLSPEKVPGYVRGQPGMPHGPDVDT